MEFILDVTVPGERLAENPMYRFLGSLRKHESDSDSFT